MKLSNQQVRSIIHLLENALLEARNAIAGESFDSEWKECLEWCATAHHSLTTEQFRWGWYALKRAYRHMLKNNPYHSIHRVDGAEKLNNLLHRLFNCNDNVSETLLDLLTPSY